MIIISFELFSFILRLVILTLFQSHEGVVNLLIYFVINSTVPSLPQSICTHFRESTNCSSSCSPCTSQTAHITPILGQLHWLPADTRILWICIPPFQRCYLHFHSRLSLWSPATVLSFLITSLLVPASVSRQSHLVGAGREVTVHSLVWVFCPELTATSHQKCNNHRYVLASSQSYLFDLQ